jgi:hypothetical protein
MYSFRLRVCVYGCIEQCFKRLVEAECAARSILIDLILVLPPGAVLAPIMIGEWVARKVCVRAGT